MSVKDPAAVTLGRRGGLARAARLTPEERTASAKLAARARWGVKRKPTRPKSPTNADRPPP